MTTTTERLKPDQPSKINCKLGVFEQADGSAYLEMGFTNVLAAVFGPHEVSRVGGKMKSTSLHDRAFVNCQYSQATFSTIDRKRKTKSDIRSLELANNVREIFDNVILTNLFPNSQIDIFLEVLQSDGSTMSACINAATLALIHAGIPIKDFVTSCSVTLIDDKTIVDVSNFEETASNLPILTLSILPKSKQIVSMESTGRVSLESVERMIDNAVGRCDEIHRVCKTVVLDYITKDPIREKQ